MLIWREMRNICLITALLFSGLSAFAQSTQTYTYAAPYGFTSNAYYSFDQVPLTGPDGSVTNISIYEGTNVITLRPYSWLLFNSGPMEGLMLQGTGWSMPAPVKAHVGYPGNTFPPVCGSACTVLSGEFSGVDPASGNAVTVSIQFNVYEYQSRIREYEIYAGGMTLSQ